MYKTQYAGCEAIGSDIFRRRLRVVKGRGYPIEYSNTCILNYIVKWPKICRLPNLYIPRTHLKNFLDPRMNIVCLFVHSRFFRVAFCLFLYLNDSFRVRKKWGCNSWPCETQKVISKKERIIPIISNWRIKVVVKTIHSGEIYTTSSSYLCGQLMSLQTLLSTGTRWTSLQLLSSTVEPLCMLTHRTIVSCTPKNSTYTRPFLYTYWYINILI